MSYEKFPREISCSLHVHVHVCVHVVETMQWSLQKKKQPKNGRRHRPFSFFFFLVIHDSNNS